MSSSTKGNGILVLSVILTLMLPVFAIHIVLHFYIKDIFLNIKGIFIYPYFPMISLKSEIDINLSNTSSIPINMIISFYLLAY